MPIRRLSMTQRRRQSLRAVPRRFSKQRFVDLMRYPQAWLSWGMYPDALFQLQVSNYEPGSEAAPEHYRYGAFRWWVSRSLSEKHIAKYVALTFLDSDQVMANAARSDLRRKLKSHLIQLSSILNLKLKSRETRL